MKTRFPAIILVGIGLVVSAEAATAQKVDVKIIDRQDNATSYAYTVPAHFNSRSDSNVTCYGDVSCSGSTTTTGSISPPRSISYQVRGATFTLQLPDGRGAVVNCESKYQPKFDYINRRDCRMPLVDNIQAEFHGNSAKLSWAVSLDGKKMQSETYKILAILEPNGIALANASQAEAPQSNPSQAAKAEIAVPASSTPVPTDKTSTALPVAAPAAKSFTVKSVGPSKDLPSTTTSNSSLGWIGITSKQFGSGGAVVTAVAAGSPAAKAGLRPGDVIDTVNGISLRDEDLDKKIAAYKPGSMVRLGYMRGSWAFESNVTVAASTQ